MDNREIARALGRSDGATKVLIHRPSSSGGDRRRPRGTSHETSPNGRRRASAPEAKGGEAGSEAAHSFEGAVARSARAGRAPAAMAERLESTLTEHHGDGGRRARGLGALAMATRATGRVGGGRRRRGHRGGCARACCAPGGAPGGRRRRWKAFRESAERAVRELARRTRSSSASASRGPRGGATRVPTAPRAGGGCR